MDVLVLDFKNALKLKSELNRVSDIQPNIIIICNAKEHELLIPACYFMFSVVDIKDIDLHLELVIESTAMGAHVFSASLRNLFHVSRMYLAPQSSFGITFNHIITLNSYLEGGDIIQIAERANKSHSTVKKHLKLIRQKLNLETNNEIIDFLRKHHWCDFKTGKLIWF